MSKHKKEIKQITLGRIVGWIFGVIFVFSGLGAFLSGSYVRGITMFVMAAVLFPPIKTVFREKMNFELSKGLIAAIIIIGFIIIGISVESETLASSYSENNHQSSISNQFKRSEEVYDQQSAEPDFNAAEEPPLKQETTNKLEVPATIQEYDHRFDKLTLPSHKEWTKNLCMKLIGQMSEEGYYRIFNYDNTLMFDDFCISQGLYDLRKLYLDKNAQEEIARGIRFQVNLAGIPYSPDDAISFTNKVFVYWNNETSKWHVVPSRIKLSWILDEERDPRVCEYIWNSDSETMNKEKDYCYKKLADRNNNSSICDSIQNDTIMQQCQNTIEAK